MILINRKLVCDVCGAVLTGETQPFLIDNDKQNPKFLWVCDKCSTERINKIREFILGQKDLQPDIAKVVNDNFWDLI